MLKNRVRHFLKIKFFFFFKIPKS